MKDRRFSALIVDDEPALRRLTATVLAQFNFTCEQAGDGEEAGNLVNRGKYDVVVTDLRMPKRNGHALATELLASGDQRPLVVVLTGVLEPRLATDLIARGVDAVEFKPVNFPLFGAKIRAMCERRDRERSGPAQPPEGPRVPRQFDRITAQQLDERVGALSGALPVSRAAIEVVNLIQDESPDAERVAQCIARDPGLSIELLKTANSAFYAHSGQRVDDLQAAILRLGFRKIGELALASATLQALTKSVLSWLDADLVWRRCLAAGHAIERLLPTANLGGDDEGLFLSAMLTPMSRVLVGLALSELYERMIRHCAQTGESLGSLERDVLPAPPEAAMAAYLAQAGLSPQLYKPLQNAAAPYARIPTLTEPLRTKVARLRVAAFCGQCAVGEWATWDEIDPPPPSILHLGRVDNLPGLIEFVRQDLARLSGASAGRAGPVGTRSANSREIGYFNLAAENLDAAAAFLESADLRVAEVSRDSACQTEPVIVSCLGASEGQITQFLDECRPSSQRLLLVGDETRRAHSPYCSWIAASCSVGRLKRQLEADAAR
jgi:CheY-like chemotaxis protein